MGFGDGSFTVPDQVKTAVSSKISSLNSTVSSTLSTL